MSNNSFKAVLAILQLFFCFDSLSQTTTLHYNYFNKPFWFDTAGVSKVNQYFFKAMEKSLCNNFDESEVLLNNILLKEDSSTVREAAKVELEKLLFYQNKFSKILENSSKMNSKSMFYEDAAFLNTFPVPSAYINHDSTSIEFKMKRKYLIIIQVLVNGKVKKFLLDSGFSRTAISRNLAMSMNLISRKSSVNIQTTNDITNLSISSLSNLSVNGMFLKNWPVCIFESLPLRNIDGVIGLDVLRKFSYRIDFPKRKIDFSLPKKKNTLVKNIFGLNTAFAIVPTINDKSIYMYFDSGSDSFELNKFALDTIPPAEIRRSLRVVVGVNRIKTSSRVNFLKKFILRYDEYILKQRNVPLTNRKTDIFLIPTYGLLNNAPFIKGILSVDFSNNYYYYKE